MDASDASSNQIRGIQEESYLRKKQTRCMYIGGKNKLIKTGLVFVKKSFAAGNKNNNLSLILVQYKVQNSRKQNI